MPHVPYIQVSGGHACLPCREVTSTCAMLRKNSTELVNMLCSLWPWAESIMVSSYVILLFNTVPVKVLSLHVTHHFEKDIKALFCHGLTSSSSASVANSTHRLMESQWVHCFLPWSQTSAWRILRNKDWMKQLIYSCASFTSCTASLWHGWLTTETGSVLGLLEHPSDHGNWKRQVTFSFQI